MFLFTVHPVAMPNPADRPTLPPVATVIESVLLLALFILMPDA